VVFSIGQIYQDRAAREVRQLTGRREDETWQDYCGRQRNNDSCQRIRRAWQEVTRHYTSWVNRYARRGTLDQKIQGHVALGRGYWNLGRQDDARNYFRIAVGDWAGAAATPQSGTPPGEATIRRELGAAEVEDAVEKSRDAVAEARFYLAEIVYRQFSSRHMPAYHGAGTRAAYDRWERATLRPWVTEQRQSLDQQATPQYQSVITMHVPQWEIAAAARLADMFFQFAQYIRNADVPPDIHRNADLTDAYNIVRDEFTQQFLNVAKVGFEGCITVSTRVHWFNEWSQLCERSLNQIDRRQYPLADEVRSEPNLVYSRPANGRPVYDLGGEADEESGGSGGGSLGGQADTSDSQPSGGGGGGSGGGSSSGGGGHGGRQ
jgi:uncharacterized membrane protein YgcG